MGVPKAVGAVNDSKDDSIVQQRFGQNTSGAGAFAGTADGGGDGVREKSTSVMKKLKRRLSSAFFGGSNNNNHRLHSSQNYQHDSSRRVVVTDAPNGYNHLRPSANRVQSSLSIAHETISELAERFQENGCVAEEGKHNKLLK